MKNTFERIYVTDGSKIYVDGSPIEKPVCIEKDYAIDTFHKFKEPVIEKKIEEVPVEESKSKSLKKKPKKVPAKRNKAAVAKI